MERIEMIEKLMSKAKVTKEVAEEALEKSNWDLLDAVIYLERKETGDAGQKEEKNKAEFGGVGEALGRVAKAIGKIVSKGCKNYFEITKDGEKPIRINLTIGIILSILGFWIVGILLIIGLFAGYKYSIVGPNIKCNEVNNILKKASSSAQDIKNDFKEGYNN